MDMALGGVKVHWTFTLFHLTHSNSYGFLDDRPIYFARGTKEPESW